MTGKSDFTEEDWKQVLEGPPAAGLLVITADQGGSIRESFSMAKAYAEARKQHGDSELLDEIVNTKPEMDKARVHSAEEMKERNLQHLRDAVALLEGKATADEIEEYRRFILNLAERVAEAHKGVTEPERAAIAEIAEALGTSVA